MLNLRRSVSTSSAYSESDVKYAVDVQNVVFGYQKNIKVLNKMTFRAVEGKIFALLGSNRSGKTTILRLILGRYKPRFGTIRVFDSRPGTQFSDIPGSGVGYMPQEVALFPEFTVKETLIYFSLIHNINISEAELRIKELLEKLDLTQNDKSIEVLSDDHKRLVSLAISFIHRPKLLILDEPTVAVDSEIRALIWGKLAQICKQLGTTVIITSHFIDEARNADTIGFTFCGKCLKFGTPEEFFRHYKYETLERIYLELCRDFIAKSKESFKYVIEDEENKFIRFQDILRDRKSEDKMSTVKKSIDFQHLKALMYGNGICLMRRPKMLCLYFFVPIVLICLMSLCFGRPRNIPIGVYSGEKRPELSKAFVDRIENKMFIKTIFKSNESSFESVLNGQNYLSVVFSENFTENFKNRFFNRKVMSNESLDGTRIRLYVDLSNPIIADFSLIYLIQIFNKFLKIFWHVIGRDPSFLSMPLEVKEMIYGETDGSYDEFLCPGLVLSIMQFFNILIATYYAFDFVSHSKIIERGFASGLTKTETYFAKTVVISALVVCQAFVISVFLFIIICYPLRGSLFDAFFLFVLQGIQGMTFGATLALVFKDIITSSLFITFLMIPLWLTSGMLWPLESASHLLQSVVPFSPLVSPVISLRYIMFRGWTLFNSFQVIYGYIVLLVYIIVFSVINYFLFEKY